MRPSDLSFIFLVTLVALGLAGKEQSASAYVVSLPCLTFKEVSRTLPTLRFQPDEDTLKEFEDRDEKNENSSKIQEMAAFLAIGLQVSVLQRQMQGGSNELVEPATSASNVEMKVEEQVPIDDINASSKVDSAESSVQEDTVALSDTPVTSELPAIGEKPDDAVTKVESTEDEQSLEKDAVVPAETSKEEVVFSPFEMPTCISRDFGRPLDVLQTNIPPIRS